MTRIGIIGAGTAGLHLGLRLQQRGVPVTLYSRQTPAETRSARLPSLVAHHAPTRERERTLGVNHWDSPEIDTFYVGFAVGGPQPLGFRGRTARPSAYLDYRLYQSRLAEDFVARGGQLHVAAVDAAAVERLASQHELVVVATGRSGLSDLFPRMPEHSPYTHPVRLLFAGLFHGIQPSQPLGMQISLEPGQGEIVEGRMMSLQGPIACVLLEAVPGGAFERLCTQRPDEDLRGFEALLLKTLRESAPATFERVDPAAFRLTGPLDWLQGGFTPVVRRGYARLGSGRCVMAVGDAHALLDPFGGLGANAASAAAWVLADAIHEAVESGSRFDEAFCQRAEARTWGAVQASVYWNHALLQPPPPHLGQLLFAASQSPGLADAFITTMTHPAEAMATFMSPENSAAFQAQHGH
ncbi:styrene monooxygenase/indole monooxygenase family protein [Hyalangium sp.]|uniref:styrene monooxygenase/indole monooxygenase family protein n=1 Tax=Hyalangium sp. TaxID=2028555 RepID=UPI002D40E587|nr:styrene monooxygenase/indole monooxygenase family protein [Hyalangium sp.]HYH95011.1 styrene monooxygenase/indole monooxygenase family protein [Hyalangium sp.]